MVSVEQDGWMNGTVFGLRLVGEIEVVRLVGWFDMRDEMR